MAEGDVGWAGLVASLVLVAVTVAVSWSRRLGLSRDVVVAAARALVQLVAVGYVLAVILDDDQSVVLAWCWVALMVLVASGVVARRAPEVPSAFRVALPAIVASTAATLGVVFGLQVFPVEARTIVPIAGMMIGNSMTGAVVSSRRIVAELTEKRPEVEARLALGQPWPEASRPYLRSALRTALVPQIESTKTVGLVSLPGSMTGLILAGVDPVDAVRVQAAVMFLILGATATNVVVIGMGLTRRLFTADHRLVHLARPAA